MKKSNKKKAAAKGKATRKAGAKGTTVFERLAAKGLVKPKAKEQKQEAKPRKKLKRRDGKMSGLDAAVKVLGEAKEPLNCKTITERALEKGYWKTNGKTPWATLSAAMGREIAAKGKASRFEKTARGTFALKA